jgi:hypothetical protein
VNWTPCLTLNFQHFLNLMNFVMGQSIKFQIDSAIQFFSYFHKAPLHFCLEYFCKKHSYTILERCSPRPLICYMIIKSKLTLVDYKGILLVTQTFLFIIELLNLCRLSRMKHTFQDDKAHLASCCQ